MAAKSSKLSTKLTGILIGYLVVAVTAVGMTLWVAWQLEGGAAAVNQMGSERMRSYKIALLLAQAAVPGADQTDLTDATRAEIADFEQVLAELEAGDPARPLVLPRSRDIRVRFDALKRQWQEQMRPAIGELLDVSDHKSKGALLSDYRRTADQFVGQIDALVYAIEQDISRNTTLLRSLQLGLMALSVVGTVTLIYLLFLLIIRPVTNLDEGMRRMEGGDFDVRLPVETRDEFGALAAGFNRMAEHLSELYRTLERRVADKTRSLEARNEELATLYESAALLSQPATLEDLCREFLRKLVARLGAQAGAVRLIQTDSGKIHLYVQEGMSAELVDAERCLDRGECLCGAAAERPHPSIHVLTRPTPGVQEYRCHKAGFQTVGVVPIRFRNQPLGVFNLFFDRARDLSGQERFMLETLGQHLGIAIENQRLVAREKEMAISEERNLLAQELHDSIAQSLAFLNLQAQMLHDSLKHERIVEARDELARIREGIQESYDDVRELLVHFRTPLAQADIETTIGAALERFEGQTGIKASFTQSGSGIPLSPEIQLQVLHIIQECLSNSRKHSAAANVQVELQRGQVYRFRVTDDGKGFDPEATTPDLHVGLSIMRERAHRIGGSLQVASRRGGGTEVTLILPVTQQAAA